MSEGFQEYAPPFPIPKNSRPGHLIPLSLIAILLLASIGFFWVFTYVNRSTPNETLNVFCNALQRGNYQVAYNQFSKTLQNSISETTFAGIFAQDKVAQCIHSNTDDSGSSATTDLKLVHASKGTNTDLVTLTRDRWKIAEIRRAYSNSLTQSAIHRFDLSARQSLRDFNTDFAVGKGGADTSIAVVPGEKVEIFATGSATVRPDGNQSGPGGDSNCHQPTMPEPRLPCYALIYSIGMAGRAGEVGAYLDFTAAAEGNIFLGVNSPNPAQNAGSFHITILTIPTGTTEGIWTVPESGFLFQSTSIILSMRAFSQQNSVARVQFTAAMPGQNLRSICTVTVPTGDTYACQWNLTNLPGNGPITFGFTINGSQGKPLVNPDGVRSGLLRYIQTQQSTNYAGYAAQGSKHEKVTARWRVPQVHCSPGENSAASVWVGMTSNVSDKSLLAQTGTDSDCQSGVPLYFLWWEIFPASFMRITSAVNPGDLVTATVTFQNGQFQLIIDDPREGPPFSTRYPGNVSDTLTAECIAEAPTIIDDIATNKGHIAQLTEFGTVSISCQVDNSPIGDVPQNSVSQDQMFTDAGMPKATTSDLDPKGSTFTVQWNHG